MPAPKRKRPDDTVKFIAGALGGGLGAVVGGPLGAALGAAAAHWATTELMKEGL